MDTHHPFTFQSTDLHALAAGALWWPAQSLLCVSDLHLGKSDRVARRSGHMLPPYETRATLEKLTALIDAHDPRTVICLGDSFDDLDAADSLDDLELTDISRLQAGRNWIWIEGNHDPGPVNIGGEHLKTFTQQGLTFRHIAEPHETGEISGHYHPKCRMARGGSRPAFLIDDDRIILPAFGTFTGGLSAHNPVLSKLMQPDAIAILTGRKALPVPMSSVT